MYFGPDVPLAREPGFTSPAGAPPPNLVRRGRACRHGQTKANGRAGCVSPGSIPGAPTCSEAHSGRAVGENRCVAGSNPARTLSARTDIVDEAVPAGAGRKARRASDRSRFRANGRAARRPARTRTTTPCGTRRRARQCGARSPARPLAPHPDPCDARPPADHEEKDKNEYVEASCGEKERTRAADERGRFREGARTGCVQGFRSVQSSDGADRASRRAARGRGARRLPAP